MKYLQRFRYTLTFLALFFAWVLLRPDPPPATYQLDGWTMGTTYRIQLWQFPEQMDENALADEIQRRLDRIDRELMSTYAPDSELSRFNNSTPGDWFPVSAETAYVVGRAIEISELTDGYFDVTVAPLVDLWGFGALERRGALPAEEEISVLRDQVDYRQLAVRHDPPALRKHTPVRVDLGGIAKGYGADVIAEFFDELELESYFIEVGGELRLRGLRADATPWVPAIERPVSGAAQAQEILCTDGRPIALAGSGDYRNYFEFHGQRYSHEIDPFTGRPVTHNLAAAYVVADTALLADALTTAFMVMGAQRALALASQEGIAAYFIMRNGDGDEFSIQYTPAFAEFLER